MRDTDCATQIAVMLKRPEAEPAFSGSMPALATADKGVNPERPEARLAPADTTTRLRNWGCEFFSDQGRR
jgi:hypothetical protein